MRMLLASLLLGVTIMGVDAQAQPDEYPERITYRYAAKAGQEVKELKDVKAKHKTGVKNEPEGTVRWNTPGGQTLTKYGQPKPGDTIIDKDGVYWTVTKVQGGSEQWSLNALKAKEQPKKD